jgi:hypothetical protein
MENLQEQNSFRGIDGSVAKKYLKGDSDASLECKMQCRAYKFPDVKIHQIQFKTLHPVAARPLTQC